MTSLCWIQEHMQAAIVSGGESDRRQLLRALKPAARAAKDQMLDIYCNAYSARLAEILENDLSAVSRYLGEELFAHVTAGYIAAHPSNVRNARWYSRRVADFLACTPPFSRWPQVAELAAIELALADAFDAADATPFTLQDLTATPSEKWASLVVRAHPSLRRLDTTTNAYEIWTAIEQDDETPSPRVLDQSQPLLVWRQDARTRLRALPIAEARGLDALLAGAHFAQACDAMTCDASKNGQAPDASQFVAWLAGWCASDLFVTPPPA